MIKATCIMRRTGLLIVLVCALVSPTLVGYASPYTSVDVGTAYGMITGGVFHNLVILDVRTQAEYDSGHIYGAMLIPVTDLQARIGELTSHINDPILVYCGSGTRSATASGILDSNNFTRVYNMLGGLKAWKTAGYPTWISTIHDVDSGLNYDTIQAAVDSALTLNGHTILVDKGVYYEHVTVVKMLTILGGDPSSTVIDANGTGTAISIKADNVTVENFTIRNGAESGVHLNGGNYAQIQNNNVTNNYCGVNISSSYNTVFDNKIGSNHCGVLITEGDSTVFENNITSNDYGVCLNNSQVSSGNLVYNNNLLNNTYQAATSGASGLWDDGYPSAGNYWSDYNGTDLFSGAFQTQKGSDGVGDTPYTIDANNTDRYPLIRPWLWGPRNLTITAAEGGTTSPAPGSYAYNTTSYVEVTAIAYSDYTFDHWELDGYNASESSPTGIRTDANHTLKAVFTLTKYALEITSTPGGSTYPSAGTYVFEPGTVASVGALSDPGCYLDGWMFDNTYAGIFNPFSVVMSENHTVQAVFKQLDVGHNIAIKWVASKSVVGQGFNLSIQVTVMNIGSYNESFSVTAYLNSTSITSHDITLDSGSFTTTTFTTNMSSFSMGNYTVWAHSWPVLNETETEDNNYTGGYVIVSAVGDLTGGTSNVWDFIPDGKVDGKDISVAAKCFGSYPGCATPLIWNVNCDINEDGKIDGRDISTVARHFGEHNP
ncbi:MAG: rhodanese-like domain-containing protein [Candidatus Bathyarchaeia archaeon]